MNQIQDELKKVSDQLQSAVVDALASQERNIVQYQSLVELSGEDPTVKLWLRADKYLSRAKCAGILQDIAVKFKIVIIPDRIVTDSTLAKQHSPWTNNILLCHKQLPCKRTQDLFDHFICKKIAYMEFILLGSNDLQVAFLDTILADANTPFTPSWFNVYHSPLMHDHDLKELQRVFDSRDIFNH